MTPRPGRTLAAALLVAAAVAVPCWAWYVAGSREAEHEARRLRELPRLEAERSATRLAEHVAIRLEALRDVEDRRPFFHYQNHYHDPFSDCECASVTPSPLAYGPTDPLVWTYFQIDPYGALSLPTLGAAVHGNHGPEWIALQSAILDTLRGAAPSLASALEGGAGGLARPGERAAAEDTDHGHPTVPAGGECREEIVDAGSWVQNLVLSTGSDAAPSADAFEASVTVEVGSFLWRSVPLGAGHTLAGLREVLTPLGRYVQGFVIDEGAVATILRGDPFPARWIAGPSEGGLEAPVPIDGADRFVSVEADPAILAAGMESREVVTRFRRLFAGGAAAAALAGLAVILLVRQTERTARQRSRFAASAAHELRTPLAGLRLYGEMLAEDLGRPERAREYADHITREADRLGRVVDNVMNYARLERGELRLRPEPGRIEQVVEDCLRGLRPAVERAGATLRFTAPAALPEVPFDRDAVHQILQNLVDNAEKYTRQVKDRVIEVALAGRDWAVDVTVRDNGPGVTRGLQPRLFRPFTRGEEEDAPAGLGLGLALVKALAGAHGGNVRYEAAPGGGAAFTVSFPLRRDA